MKKKISREETERAIYIDYEGNTDRPPTLLGWSVDGSYHAAILESSFLTCQNRYRAKEIFYIDHKVLAKKLIKQASRACKLFCVNTGGSVIGDRGAGHQIQS